FFDPGTVAGTLEELIVRDLAYLGPVVAIGNPSDQLPALGAARKYCQGDEWHEVVQSLMDEAIMIVVGADLSEGLPWEIATIRRKGIVGKTTFILPPGGIADKGVLLSLLRLLWRSGDARSTISLCSALPGIPSAGLGGFAGGNTSNGA